MLLCASLWFDSLIALILWLFSNTFKITEENSSPVQMLHWKHVDLYQIESAVSPIEQFVAAAPYSLNRTGPQYQRVGSSLIRTQPANSMLTDALFD